MSRLGYNNSSRINFKSRAQVDITSLKDVYG